MRPSNIVETCDETVVAQLKFPWIFSDMAFMCNAIDLRCLCSLFRGACSHLSHGAKCSTNWNLYDVNSPTMHKKRRLFRKNGPEWLEFSRWLPHCCTSNSELRSSRKPCSGYREEATPPACMTLIKAIICLRQSFHDAQKGKTNCNF